MFQKINEAYETVAIWRKKSLRHGTKGGGGDISELDDILKCFLMGGGMHHCSSLAIWAEGGGEEVTVNIRHHMQDSETAAVWENRIFRV
jgi:hypothetical protein